ncbi:transporter [Bacteroidia bacterium]|nr:transporter [Bacteroidia bacterium]
MIRIRNAVFLGWLFAAVGLNAQTLKIDDCYTGAEANYPLVKHYALIEKSKNFSVENAQKAYLPQFGIYGQATYQSDVTKIPIDFSDVSVPALANVKMPELPKDQYKVYADVSYSLTNLVTNKNQTDLAKANAEIETQKIEIELYKLRERINALFFGVLVIDAQIAQTELVKEDIQNGIARIETAVAGGVALKSTADNLKAELLKTKQRTTELKAARKGYSDMLSLFIGAEIDEHTILEKPLPPRLSNEINRPEMRLYNLQNRAFDLQNRTVSNRNLPQFNLFFQGGVGKPALNMFSDSFDPYFVTGVRLSWNLSGFYTVKNERKQIAVNQEGIHVQEEMFLFNTNLAVSQQNTEITKMQELIADDNAIIQLRENVKKSAQTQLDNGTATTNDYLTAVNAEDNARQSRILHEIQLLMYLYNMKTTLGN